MTTLISKVGQRIFTHLNTFKDKFCNDGYFCDDFAMGLLSVLTVWMMYVAMLPIL